MSYPHFQGARWKRQKASLRYRERLLGSMRRGRRNYATPLRLEMLEPRTLLSVTSSPAPDMTATKTNDVGGVTTPGTSWTWTIRVENEGDATANFTVEDTVLVDSLPGSNIAYGTVTVTPNTTNVTCFIDSSPNLICFTNSGGLSMADGDFFDVSFTATPSAVMTYVNPRTGVEDLCRTDPWDSVDELDESNNDCSDTVRIEDRDLTAIKTDDVSGATTLGNSWTWTIEVANSGVSTADFAQGETVLIDNLPDSDISYGAVTVSPNTTNVNCSIVNSDLTCTAGTGGFSLPASGSFDVSFTATPSAAGTFANPRSGRGNQCAVDPNSVSLETDESNNNCNDTVVVTAPDLTATKTNNVGGATTLGNNWTWNVRVANGGDDAANFLQGATVLLDNLPDAVSYGSATVTPNTTNVSCFIDASNNMGCSAGAGGLSVPASGFFDVSFTATPLATGTFSNPRSGGTNQCQVDPNSDITESDESNNTCSNTVVVTAPDLTVVKTNNVGGETTLGNNWTWNLRVTNGGNAAASFAQGATVLLDNLSSGGATYGAVTVSPNSTNMNCTIDGSTNLICTAGPGGLNVPVSSSFDVFFTVTPTLPGTHFNPIPDGTSQCKVDPNNDITESDENNNTSSDQVVVRAPNLTAAKTNNVSDTTTLGNNWTWTVNVANSGNSAASFAQGATVLVDNLPNSNVTYGAVSVSPNTTNVNCSIDASSNLNCTAGTGGLSVPASSSFNVIFTATPSATGTFSNPRSGGTNQCKVDPNNVIAEPNENNNTCSDSVFVTAPDLEASKTNDVGGATTLGNSWTWNVRVDARSRGVSFAEGTTVLLDNLPDMNVEYGAVTVSGDTTNVNCAIDGSKNLICTAGTGGLNIGGDGRLTVSFTATPTAIGTFNNPRSGGTNQCKFDPNNVIAEENENNNSCSDSVVVTAPDLTVTKTNDVGGETTLGNSWTWNLRVANGGNAAASFAQGATVLFDNLNQSASITYGAVTVSPNTTNVNCNIDGSKNLSCTAGTGGLNVPVSSFFDVFFTATPTITGSFSNPNPDGFGQCRVDPNSDITESNESNNSCSDGVRVRAPNLNVVKTNNISGATTLGNNWSWNLRVSNTGDSAANFAQGDTMLLDNLPDNNVSYGAVTVTPNTTNVSCSIDGSKNLSCTAGTGGLSVPAFPASFDVSFTATPTATGTFSNPRSGGTNQCKVDPNNSVTESNENNNTCSDSVVVRGSDLTVTKSNDVGGALTGDDTWTWTLHVENSGDSSANFSQGAAVLVDNLPDTNISYGTVTVSPIATNVSCSIDAGQNLTCTAGTGGLSIPAPGSFDVSFTATTTASGTITNPRSSGQCTVDPNNGVSENNENDNSCSDAINVVVCPPFITNTTLTAGRNRIQIINGEAGNIIALYTGTQNGSYYVKRYGVTIDIADPVKKSQVVVASNGVAIAYINVPRSFRGRTLLLQGYEKYLRKCVTNLVTVDVPLMAEGGEGPGASELSASDASAILEQAKQRWMSAGLGQEELDRLNNIELEITDLPDGQLGETAGTKVYLDLTAAGYGWYVDRQPGDDSEFATDGAELKILDDMAANQMDLLTVLMHELGHVIGLPHSDDSSGGLLDDTLETGQRRLPDPELIHEASEFEVDVAMSELTGEAGYAMDVNEDGWVTPLDSLGIINHLSQSGAKPVSGQSELVTLDVSGDGWVSPLDALQVINDLNSQGIRAIPREDENDAADIGSFLLASTQSSASMTTAEGESAPAVEPFEAAPLVPVQPVPTSTTTPTTRSRRTDDQDACDEELLEMLARDVGSP